MYILRIILMRQTFSLFSTSQTGDVVIMENAPEFYPTVEIRVKECKGT